MLKKLTGIMLLAGLFFTMACSNDDNDYVNAPTPQQESPVVFNLEQIPYPKLSDYNFFEGPQANHQPVYGVLPYSIINTLFSDYAKKQRFVWMPQHVQASYTTAGNILEFPTGTILIKTFFYDHVLPTDTRKLIETRLMIKKQNGWVFANYVWDNDQNDALLDLNGSFHNIEWQALNQTRAVNYRVPSEAECHTCHKSGEVSIPIGPKPRNLNMTYPYSEGTKNQLQKWQEMGYLDQTLPEDVPATPNWKDESLPLTLRARAYLDINCAHCHSEEAHCAYRPVRFDFEASENLTNLGVCVEPDTDLGVGLTHIVTPGNPNRSVLHYRLNATDESVRMPLLGRTLVQDEGLLLIENWITSLENNCN
ncbi:MAG: hypothetical protein GYB39_02135 [Algicola sp.]|nr:hypothetical protein [Algicola sp.]